MLILKTEHTNHFYIIISTALSMHFTNILSNGCCCGWSLFCVLEILYKKQPSIGSVISERQGRFQNQARLLTEWDTLSKEERVKEFYAKFTDIIMNYIPSTGENQQQQITNQLLQTVHHQLEIAYQTLEEARVTVQAANLNQPDNPAITQLLGDNNRLRNANQHLRAANEQLREVVILLATYQQLLVIREQLLQAANLQLQAANWHIQAGNQQQRIANLNQEVLANSQLSNQEFRTQLTNGSQGQENAANEQRDSASQMRNTLAEGINQLQNANVLTLTTANNQLRTANDQLHTANGHLAGIVGPGPG